MKTEAIVIKTVRYSDQKVVAHLFTRRYGMLPFVVRRPTAGRRGLSSALMQPLTQLVVECDPSANRQMQLLRQAELSMVYASIPFSPHKSAIALFLGEFLWHALRGEQASDALYEYVSYSLQWLDGAEEDYANFHLIFLLQLTRYMGYDPTHLPEAESLQIDRLMRHNFRTMRLLRLNGRQRTYFLERLAAFYRDNVPGFPELNALGVLSEVFRT